jgi:hypothetical protein
MFSKTLVLSSCLVAFSQATITWPPNRGQTNIKLMCGYGAMTTNPNGDCCPQISMNRQQCSMLANDWISAKCGAVAAFVKPSTTTSYVNRAVSWIGPGTPKPCFDKALKLKKNPARYCKMVDQDTHWQDGGCRLWDEW